MIDYSEIKGLDQDLKKVNEHIRRLCKSDDEVMQKMMDEVILAQGKQIRPLLTLLCSRLNQKRADASETAAVIEICHTASLIHDDIIDHSDYRRGKPSLQKQFGPEMAVYAGDFMIFSTIGRTQLTNKPWYKKMFQYLEVMCNGEVSQYAHQFDMDITEEQYISNIIGKTSAMFIIACESVAYEGKCSYQQRQAIERFAKYFGLVFQIRDDLSDLLSTKKSERKTIHSDLKNGYYTLPVIHTFSHPIYGEQLREIAKKVRREVDNTQYDETINKIIRSAGGYAYAVKQIKKYYEAAVSELRLFKDSPSKKALLSITAYLIDHLPEDHFLSEGD